MHGVKYLTGWHHTENDRERREGDRACRAEARRAKAETNRELRGDSGQARLDSCNSRSRSRPWRRRWAATQSRRRRPGSSGDGEHQRSGGVCRCGTTSAAGHGHGDRRGDMRTRARAQTDDNGTFVFTNLPPGEYTLSANKGGFVESIYGQRQPGSGRLGTPITVDRGAAAQRSERAPRARRRPDRRRAG